ncbi:MAG: hypothetical protein V2B13_05580 [Pseudomonadota bacterium]
MKSHECNHQENSLKKRLMWRFAIFVAVMMGSIIAIVTFMFVTALTRELKTSLALHASHSLQFIEQRVAFLAENVTTFSRNHFIVNSLIDPAGRTSYLPKMVSDFSKVQDLSAVFIVDFEGKVIRSSVPHSPKDLKTLNLRKVLAEGESLFQVSQDLKSVIITSPIE